MINSKSKGAKGEREFASFLREQGFCARRGQQFSGTPDSPDVLCESFPFHIEVKRVERLNLRDACAQAEGECGQKKWVVAHRWNHGLWLVTLKADVFCDLVREVLNPLPPLR